MFNSKLGEEFLKVLLKGISSSTIEATRYVAMYVDYENCLSNERDYISYYVTCPTESLSSFVSPTDSAMELEA